MLEFWIGGLWRKPGLHVLRNDLCGIVRCCPGRCRFWIAIATLWQIQQLRCPRRDQIEFKTGSELSALGEPMDHTLGAFCVKADDLMVRGKVKPLIFCRQVTAALHLWQRLCRFLLQWTTNNMTILARFEWGAHHPKVVSLSYKLVYKPHEMYIYIYICVLHTYPP